MSVYAGPADWWTDGTDAGRNHIATKGIVQSGLVLNLDAGVSSSYPGSGTTWTDLSSGGNNVSLVNVPSFDSSNFGSLNFDGSTQYGSFAGVSSNFSLGSVECWCKCDTPTSDSNQHMVSRTNTSAGTFNIYKSNLSFSNKFLFTIRLTTGTQYFIYSNSSATTNWVHVVGTYDGAIQKMYVNGVQQTLTTSISGTLDTTGTLVMNIGRNTNGNVLTYFDGKISKVNLYNRALSAAEILQNFNALRGRFGI